MLHAMVDIETLGVGVSAPLFEIGAVAMDMEVRHIVGQIHLNVDVMDVMWRTGFVPQEQTLSWWRSQVYNPSEIRDRMPLDEALGRLTEFLESHSVKFVWGNSPAFDMVILQRHYEAVGMTAPWRYSRELDYRTMKWIYTQVHGEPDGPLPINERPHDALSDARHQASLLFGMMGGINVSGV